MVLFVGPRSVWSVALTFRGVALALVAFALSYVVVRFVLVGLARWATAGEENSIASQIGPPVAKFLAFCNALTVASGVAGIDLSLTWLYSATVVFFLAAVVYRFERLLAERRLSA